LVIFGALKSIYKIPSFFSQANWFVKNTPHHKDEQFLMCLTFINRNNEKK